MRNNNRGSITLPLCLFKYVFNCADQFPCKEGNESQYEKLIVAKSAPFGNEHIDKQTVKQQENGNS